ncbi:MULTISPECIES: hypothetical protein [unclassified Rhizobium]|uniref:hypothetical protein n=1 Tax=unclassified Rhizobium TaxID=2613769 RepID=UPI00167A9AA9|nr:MULTISPECIES: hypothetical protein [unclassified Rhizobium]
MENPAKPSGSCPSLETIRTKSLRGAYSATAGGCRVLRCRRQPRSLPRRPAFHRQPIKEHTPAEIRKPAVETLTVSSLVHARLKDIEERLVSGDRFFVGITPCIESDPIKAQGERLPHLIVAFCLRITLVDAEAGDEIADGFPGCVGQHCQITILAEEAQDRRSLTAGPSA